MKSRIRHQYCEDDERFNAGFDAALEAIGSEIASVLQQLDHLAEVWGDEGVFRRCRDRLRALMTDEETK